MALFIIILLCFILSHFVVIATERAIATHRLAILHRLGYCPKQRAGFKCSGKKGECN